MPLLVVCSADRTRRKFVAADSVASVIHKAAQKLELDGDDLKLFVDCGSEQGLEVDEDDVLRDLSLHCSSSGKHLVLVALPTTESWSPPSRQPTEIGLADAGQQATSSALNRGEEMAPTVSSVVPTPLRRPNVLSTPPLPIDPVKEIFSPVQEALRKRPVSKNISRIKRQAVKEVAQYTANFIVKKVANFTRPVAAMYAQSIFSYDHGVFAPIFVQYVNQQKSDDGLDAFICSIYNMINYRKGEENKTKRKKSGSSTSGDSDVDGDLEERPSKKNPILTDDYGCVMYNPPLPEGESEESQEIKRVKLLEESIEECPTVGVFTLLKQTYASQRSDINKCARISALSEVFSRWPHLLVARHIIDHSSILLGKDVPLMWSTMLDKRTEELLGFLSFHARLESDKDVIVPSSIQQMVKTIQEMEEALHSSDSIEAKSVAVFMLVSLYMKEDGGYFIRHIEDVGDDQKKILESAEKSNGNPILLVQGHSIFDSSKCSVVVLNKHLIKCQNVLEGVLVAFLAYYVFGFKYIKECQATLEFIQRFFLSINPTKGDKRAKARRGVSNVCSKVVRLSDALASHFNQWNVS